MKYILLHYRADATIHHIMGATAEELSSYAGKDISIPGTTEDPETGDTYAVLEDTRRAYLLERLRLLNVPDATAERYADKVLGPA